MHEVSLVADLVDVCLSHAARLAAPVSGVRVRYATTIPEDGLRQAFEMLTRDTPLAGAILDAQPFDRILDCSVCGARSALSHDDIAGPMAACPRCDEPAVLPPTAELELLELTCA